MGLRIVKLVVELPTDSTCNTQKAWISRGKQRWPGAWPCGAYAGGIMWQHVTIWVALKDIVAGPWMVICLTSEWYRFGLPFILNCWKVGLKTTEA